MQAAVCEDVIGWKNVTKILVYTSDDTFHIAGDGRLVVSMSLTTADAISTEDYPSIGHLARVLKANNIKLVFAVTENIAEAYKRLSQMIPQSVVGVLKSDSSNVVQLITNAYNSLSSTILLEHHDAPQGLAVSYQAHCVPSQGPVPWRSSGECKDIKLNQQVDFTVQLTISECLKEATEFHLSVQGISEKLRVSVATRASATATRKCDIGFKGRRCEKQCGNTTDVGLLKVACHQDNPLSTATDAESFKGKFCECDDGNCEKRNQKLCSATTQKNGTIVPIAQHRAHGSKHNTLHVVVVYTYAKLCSSGNGKCSCGKCECFPSHKGEACDCSTSTASARRKKAPSYALATGNAFATNASATTVLPRTSARPF
ncbi:Integrin beta-7 [Merluccius polli]|uniref:Integrin beta n=1 Tax=Merluccius polli TaxID=89951 RepID=A0AA47N0Z2_MERPO|nr:Integrin beta-7 [Merluccius polli]